MRADAIELSTIARATTTNSNFIIILISLKIICSKEKPLLKEDGHSKSILCRQPSRPITLYRAGPVALRPAIACGLPFYSLSIYSVAEIKVCPYQCR